MRWSFLPQISWKGSDRQEVLRIHRGHMKCGNTTIRWPCDMEFIVLDFVVCQNLFQKFGEDTLPAFEEQLVVRCCRDHDDVATLLRLIAKIPGDDVIHYVHGLRSAAKRKDAGVGFAGIKVLWEHDLVMNG